MLSDIKIVKSSLMNDGVDGGARVIMCPESLSIHPDDIDKKIACIKNLSMDTFAAAHKKQEEMKVEQKEISMNKKYTYRNGEPARVLCVDRKNGNGFCVVSMMNDGDIVYHGSVGNFRLDNIPYHLDLVEVKEKKQLWINICIDRDGEPYCYSYGKKSDAIADYKTIDPDEEALLARVKVEFEEGQFDE